MAHLDPPISRTVARQAAQWLMRLHGQPPGAAQQHACAQWRAAHPDHERAWQRVQQVQQQLGGLPPALAMGTLNRERRQALKTLLVLGATLPAGYLGYRFGAAQGWAADYRTAVGERQQVILADGSVVNLNTDSAIDVRFDATQRLIQLLRGEIFIISGADRASAHHRPLRVASADGVMEPLGTRFNVRQFDTGTQVTVLEGRVMATPRRAHFQIVEAGQQVRFDRQGFGPLQAAQAQLSLWTKGQLVADDLPLADFVRELGRYRPGVLRCDPSVADLRISGAFQLDNSDAILAALPTTLAVRVSYRTRYWVTVGKA
ncbi:FecR domain-containing protein [Pseudomonas putida]